jgi:hypothetical protein
MCGPKPCEKEDCTWGEKHRKECEARTVMRWSREKRTAYYAAVKTLRGESAVMDLIEEVKRQWSANQ